MDQRTLFSAGSSQGYREDNHIAMVPHANLGTLGLSYHPDPTNTLEFSGEYFGGDPRGPGCPRSPPRGRGRDPSDYDRRQTGYELESETGLTGAYEHDFPKEDHTLRWRRTSPTRPRGKPPTSRITGGRLRSRMPRAMSCSPKRSAWASLARLLEPPGREVQVRGRG